MPTNDTTLSGVRIDPTWTVNEVVLRHPGTLAVFHAFGLDACCGGGRPVVEAARRHGADRHVLVAALPLARRSADG